MNQHKPSVASNRFSMALVCIACFLTSNLYGFQDAPSDEPEAQDKPAAKESIQSDDSDEIDFLKIGGPAPGLEIDRWLTDNDGLHRHVKKYETGKVYVLNFFQTEDDYTLGHLKTMVQLQRKYATALQMICVSIDDYDATDEFLDVEFKGDDEAETYLDLLTQVSTVVDSDGGVVRDYVGRSGSSNALTFIVGKAGKVQWIGLPADVAGPLAQVIKGTWNTKTFATKLEKEQLLAKRRDQHNRKFTAWYVKVTEGKSWQLEELLEKLTEGVGAPKNSEFKSRIEAARLTIMMLSNDDDLPSVIRSYTDMVEGDLYGIELNDTAWQVYEMYEAGQTEKNSELMKSAKYMAEKALKYNPKSGAVNDTVAHFIYLLDGDLDKAIKLQKTAIENARDTQVDNLQKFLDFLLKEKSTGEKKSLQQGKDVEEEDSEF